MSQAQPYALAHALAYASQGLPVLALQPTEKRPSTAACPRGFHDATTDPATIARWFEQVPDAGVGIYPGPAGLLVLDLDDKPGSPRGADALAELEAAHGPLPATLRQRTPSAGQALHLVFTLPEGFDPARIGNRGLAPGIDVRCSAGYIGAEPTRVRMPDGRLSGYAFDDWDILAGEVPEVAEAPTWLLALLTVPESAPSAASDGAASAEPRELATPHQVAELRSALNALDADDYATWIACGHGLRGLGAVGRELWLTWSQQSAKWQPSDAQRWHGFAADHAGFRAVFARAQAAGWVNPASKGAALPGGPVTQPGEARGPAAPTPGAAAPAPWQLVPVADLDSAVIPPQAWAWEGYIPAGEVTLMAAHGGTGKSMLALMLAASVALGLPLFGVATTPAPVVFYSAEDRANTVRSRLRAILAALGVESAHLAGRLLILDASQTAPELAAQHWSDDGQEGGRQVFGLTRAGTALADLLAPLPEPLLIVDNASDTFGGNENARPEVRAFVRLLAGLVRRQNGAVLLLAHVDKASARGFGGGESYSGSTAWHNSARSRLLLEREKDGRGLTLTQMKTNLGCLRDPLRLVWHPDRLPELDAPQSGIVGRIDADNNTRALLRLIHEFTRRGEFVSTATTSPAHAGRLLRGSAGFPARLTNTEVSGVLRKAESRGHLVREWVRSRGRGHEKEVWRVTPAGADAAGFALPAPTAPTAPTTDEGAPGAESRGGCADCADFGAGGVGGVGAQEVGAEVAS